MASRARGLRGPSDSQENGFGNIGKSGAEFRGAERFIVLPEHSASGISDLDRCCLMREREGERTGILCFLCGRFRRFIGDDRSCGAMGNFPQGDDRKGESQNDKNGAQQRRTSHGCSMVEIGRKRKHGGRTSLIFRT